MHEFERQMRQRQVLNLVDLVEDLRSLHLGRGEVRAVCLRLWK